jgi:hypothetical protein
MARSVALFGGDVGRHIVKGVQRGDPLIDSGHWLVLGLVAKARFGFMPVSREASIWPMRLRNRHAAAWVAPGQREGRGQRGEDRRRHGNQNITGYVEEARKRWLKPPFRLAGVHFVINITW